jgi:hypothetical protein
MPKHSNGEKRRRALAHRVSSLHVGVRPHLKVMQSREEPALEHALQIGAGGDWLTTNMVLRYQSDTIDSDTCGGADETGPFFV